ncbi:MAG: hypothetical protein PHF37_05670 [Phycisphaerae bacterium]|nr:hypothetical protein [Phycisphaerae bacterium]
MRVELFVLCDAATADAGGKLNILGAFDTLWVAKLPSIHPQCTIALRIRFEPHEAGSHNVRVNFIDADGNHIIPSANGKIDVQFKDQQRSAAANLILNLQRLKLDRTGEYSIDLAIDNQGTARLPLFICQRPQRTIPTEPQN